MSSTNAAVAIDSSIVLNWNDVTAANLYHLQVSLRSDFSGAMVVEDAALATSGKSFADSSTDDRKRFWRWRSSANAGTTWSAWSEVGHYWLGVTLAAEVVRTTAGWALVNPDNTADIYTLADYPVHATTDVSIRRARERNRSGDLLTEWLISKATVELQFPETIYMTHEQMREFKRFELEVQEFFLVGYVSNGVDLVPHIWKVIFNDDPTFAILGAGREDLFVATLSFEEV